MRKGPPKDDFHPPLKLANYVPRGNGQMTKRLCGFRVNTGNVGPTTPRNRVFDRNLGAILHPDAAQRPHPCVNTGENQGNGEIGAARKKSGAKFV
jgi:hypothetical protein